jgi:hypothetical protein
VRNFAGRDLQGLKKFKAAGGAIHSEKHRAFHIVVEDSDISENLAVGLCGGRRCMERLEEPVNPEHRHAKHHSWRIRWLQQLSAGGCARRGTLRCCSRRC